LLPEQLGSEMRLAADADRCVIELAGAPLASATSSGTLRTGKPARTTSTLGTAAIMQTNAKSCMPS
jgi:hypothetical protein